MIINIGITVYFLLNGILDHQNTSFQKKYQIFKQNICFKKNMGSNCQQVDAAIISQNVYSQFSFHKKNRQLKKKLQTASYFKCDYACTLGFCKSIKSFDFIYVQIINQCSACYNGYYLFNQGVSIPVCQACTTQYCQGCSQNGCNTCSYYSKTIKDPITNQITCILCQSYMCISCNINISVCNQCYYNYFLQNQKCSPCSSNCKLCSSNTNCNTCFDYYYLQNKICLLGTIDNCITPKSVSICSKCKPKFVTNTIGDACINCPLGYQVCDSPKYYKCSQGYFIKYEGFTKVACLPCLPICYVCVNNVDCWMCYPHYYKKIENGIASCQLCAPSCNNCTQTNPLVCTVCIDTFFINSQSICAPCHPTCQICFKYPECYACIDGYFVPPEILRQSTTCIPCSNTCKNCLTATSCVQCYCNGYFPVQITYINENKVLCQSCPEVHYYSSTLKQCLRCHGSCNSCCNEHTCTNCIKGYQFISQALDSLCEFKCPDGQYKLDFTCYPCDHSCFTCLNSNSCNTCPARSGFIGPVHSSFCRLCQSNEYLKQHICTACSNTCIQCLKSESCQACATGLGFASQALIKIGLCVECPVDSFLFQNYCLKCHPSCKSCNQLNACMICLDGQHFDGTPQQSLCRVCSQHQFIGAGRCVQCHSSCSTCSSSYSCDSCAGNLFFRPKSTEYCTVCMSSDFVRQGACVPCDASCKRCDNQSACIQCLLGLQFIGQSEKSLCHSLCGISLYFKQGSCLPCDSSCRMCPSVNSCYSCVEGYGFAGTVEQSLCHKCQNNQYLASLVCNNCPSACATCISDSACLKCADGYGFSDQTKGGLCSKCTSGTFSANQICKPCHNSCKTCLASNQCLECKTGLNFAGQEHLSSCRVCISSQFVSEGKCLACDSSCLTCASNLQCIKCIEGMNFSQKAPSLCRYCLTSQFVLEGICMSCDDSCRRCLIQSACLQCEGKRIFAGAAQKTLCRHCQASTFFESDRCYPCKHTCQTCTTQTSCLSCISTLYLGLELTCRVCTTDQYVSGSRCERCPASCTSCSSMQACLGCAGRLTLKQGRCKEGTPSWVVRVTSAQFQQYTAHSLKVQIKLNDTLPSEVLTTTFLVNYLSIGTEQLTVIAVLQGLPREVILETKSPGQMGKRRLLAVSAGRILILKNETDSSSVPFLLQQQVSPEGIVSNDYGQVERRRDQFNQYGRILASLLLFLVLLNFLTIAKYHLAPYDQLLVVILACSHFQANEDLKRISQGAAQFLQLQNSTFLFYFNLGTSCVLFLISRTADSSAQVLQKYQSKRSISSVLQVYQRALLTLSHRSLRFLFQISRRAALLRVVAVLFQPSLQGKILSILCLTVNLALGIIVASRDSFWKASQIFLVLIYYTLLPVLIYREIQPLALALIILFFAHAQLSNSLSARRVGMLFFDLSAAVLSIYNGYVKFSSGPLVVSLVIFRLLELLVASGKDFKQPTK